MQRQPGAAGGKQRRCGNCKSPDAVGERKPSGWAGFTPELPLPVATALRVHAETQSLDRETRDPPPPPPLFMGRGRRVLSGPRPLGAKVFQEVFTSAPSWPSSWSARKKTWSGSTRRNSETELGKCGSAEPPASACFSGAAIGGLPALPPAPTGPPC